MSSRAQSKAFKPRILNMTDPYVKIDIINEVGYIEFFHPAHNSLPGDLLAELAKTITDAGTNDAIKVIVLKSGKDRTFCAGASFKELININDEATGKVFFSGFANVINAMRKCPKFIIGRIHAAIKLSELNIGIGPFVVGPAIERKIGLSGMSQIAIDANSFYSAEWAQQKGLFTHVYQGNEELDEAVKETAEHLCTYNVEAMQEMKKIFWQGTDHWDTLLAERAQISGRLVLSEFTKEKLKGFK